MGQKVQLKKIKNWHESLSDYLIANPQSTLDEVAEVFQVTRVWISFVKNSDAFKDYHSKRRQQHFDNVSIGVGEKLTVTAEMVSDEILTRLENQREDMEITTLIALGKMALDALGYSKGGMNVHIQNHDNRSVTINDTTALARSRERLEQLRKENDAVLLDGRIEEAQVVT